MRLFQPNQVLPVLLLLCAWSASAQVFTDINPALSATNNYGAQWADFDNDGDLDVYYGGSIYRNDGSLTFTRIADLFVGSRNAVAWADFDNDGQLDIAVATSGRAAIYRNANGVFTEIAANLVQTLQYPALGWGDYDNDGRSDLILSGYTSDGGRHTYLYHNEGNNTFTIITNAGFANADEAAFAWGDYDNDGRLDLLMCGGIGPSTFFTGIYHNNGNGTFTLNASSMIGVREGSVSWGDYNNDGYLDALVTGFYYGSYILNVYRNNRDGTFTDLNLGLQGTAFGNGQWVDYDSDGYLDIFVSGCTVNYCDASTATLYHNNHDSTFTGLVGLPNTYSTTPGCWGDFDGDGDLDLMMNHLYRNNSAVSNSPPTAPTGLSAQLLVDNNVRLIWSSGNDAQNVNGAGLSYAIRVGTTPGGNDILTANANPTTGFRRLPERGLLNTNACLLRNLPKGTYYWSVQSIDAGFAGSVFAAQNTFTITNARPIVSSIPNQLTVPLRSTPPVSFTISDVETSASNLVLSAFSSDTSVLTVSEVTFGGSGSNRTVTLKPHASGSANVTIFATDVAGLAGSNTFTLVSQTFTDAGVGLPVVTSSGRSAWGDYNNDGWLDIAVAGAGVSYTTIYRNNAATFSPAVSNLPNRYNSDLAWTDYNNDGNLDLAIAGWDGSGYTPMFYLFKNSGTNSFSTVAQSAVTNVANGAMAWGDYDNNGSLDLLLIGDPDTYHVANGFTRLYRNNNGALTNSGVVFTNLVIGTCVWGDYDNDGRLDLLLAGQTGGTPNTNFTKLFRNNGNNVFTEVATPFSQLSPCAAAFGDYNNDGLLDIALAGSGTNGFVTQIYRNTGSGFVIFNAGLVGVTAASLAWGDYDSDGYLDLVVAGSTTGYSTGLSTRVYHNNAGLSFSDTGTTLAGLYSHTVAWGDYDNDGDLDLLVGAKVYRNNFNVSNAPPSAPTSPSADVNGRSVTLSWTAPTDANQTNRLSYNGRIGTAPGRGDIKSPLAQANGRRAIPALGNVNNCRSWTINGLTNGTYYWSVQSIDSSFAGSSFTPEQSFTLSFTNHPPIINSQSDFLFEDTSVNIHLTGYDPDGDTLSLSVASPPSYGVLTGPATNLFYTPISNYFGHDEFTYIASDGSVTSAPAVVSITIYPVQDVPTAQCAVVKVDSKPAHLTLYGEPWTTYQVDATADFIQWIPVGTFLQTSNSFEWVDPDVQNFEQRFYRISPKP